MNSSRVAMLGAFGVGCLSTALVFGFWHADNGRERNGLSHVHARSADVVAASLVPQRVDGAEIVDDVPRSPARAEPAALENADHTADAKNEPAAAKETADVANANPPAGGSAVSDVLTDLEAAYRQRLIAAARAEAADHPAPEAPLERTAPPSPSPPQVEPPREVAAQAVAAPVPAAPPAAVAPAAPPVEPPSVAVDVPPTATIVAQNDARPVDVHIGDVNQNTYITNVRQGDVYVIQQQLAMLNYMAGMGAYPGAAHAPHAPHGMAQHQSQSQFKQFPSTLTNLDNPWGFNLAPPNLVH